MFEVRGAIRALIGVGGHRLSGVVRGCGGGEATLIAQCPGTKTTRFMCKSKSSHSHSPLSSAQRIEIADARRNRAINKICFT